MVENFIKPNWPAAKTVHAFTTTRQNGYSKSPYNAFNLASHVKDDIKSVIANRKLLKQQLNLPNEPTWLNQRHENIVIDASEPSTYEADGAYTNQKDVICTVLTADCLPILLCNSEGTEIAALHAGWRGLTKNIIESGIKKFINKPQSILAWLGPAIDPEAFEVGETVRKQFLEFDPQTKPAFKQSQQNKWKMNIYKIAEQQLLNLGVTKIFSSNLCTYTNEKLFYSYRRNNQTGRMASLIWLS